jgi:hypothetical protein
MKSQRAEAKGAGLPGTACAPDLFTRIDALGEADFPGKDFPVRFILGFSDGSADIAKIAPVSFMGEMRGRFAAQEKDPWWIRPPKNLLFQMLAIIVWAGAYMADLLALAKIGPRTCNAPALKAVRAQQTGIELICRFFGGDPAKHLGTVNLARQYLCPTQVVTPGEAQSAYLADVLDEQALHDYGRSGGLCDHSINVNVETSKYRPGSADVTELYYRGVITYEAFQDQHRQLGYLDANYVQFVRDLHEFWPGPGEWIGWMKSGFSEDGTAADLQLDRDFDLAYKQQQQTWANHDGYTDTQAKLHWRATYAWPDTITAIDWYRRTLVGLIPQASGVSDDDLRQIIARSTTPPAYQDAVYQSRWTPLSSRLLRAAYDLGLATDEQVLSALIVDGLAPPDAQLLLSEWSVLRMEYTATRVGLPSVSKLYSMYGAFEIGQADFAAGCARRGLRPDEVSEAQAGAHAERVAAHRGEVLKIVKSEYMRGAVDEVAVNDVLLNLGLDLADVQEAVALWQYEFSVSPRPNVAGELAKSYKLGLINESEYVNALTRLRFTREQIGRILAAEQIAEMAADLKRAETLVGATRKRISAEMKDWSSKIGQAERWLGKINRASKPNAGKLMSWVSAYVTGTPAKPLPHTPNPELLYAPSNTALETQASQVETGPSGTTAPGITVAAAVANGTPAPATGTTGAGGGTATTGAVATGTGAASGGAAAPGAGLMSGNGSIDLNPPPAEPGPPQG